MYIGCQIKSPKRFCVGQAWWFTDVYGFGPNVGLMEILSTFHYLNISLHVTKHRLKSCEANLKAIQEKLFLEIVFLPP